jgi:hypothetical protein
VEVTVVTNGDSTQWSAVTVATETLLTGDGGCRLYENIGTQSLHLKVGIVCWM